MAAPVKVRLRATSKMGYGTRRMYAADEDGSFEIKDRLIGRALVALNLAEPAEDPRRRGRPPKERAPEPEPAPAASERDDDGLEDLTHDELVDLAEKRGIELPSGYVRNDVLINIIRGSSA